MAAAAARRRALLPDAAAPDAPRAAPFAAPDGVLVQGAHETWFVLLGRSLSGVRAPVILDVHGDWRSSTRLYGSPARRLLNPLADRVAVSALRRADAVRTISDYTTGLVRSHGVEPAAVFPAFMDLEPFLGADRAAAGARRAPSSSACSSTTRGSTSWPRRGGSSPRGSRTRRSTSSGAARGARWSSGSSPSCPDRTEWTEALPTEGVARALDAATVLVLPSRSEGMGRVLVEAFCRGRAVVASRVGRDRRPRPRRRERPPRPAAATRRRSPTRSPRCSPTAALAERLGAGAAAERRRRGSATPEEYAARLEALVAGLR